jgi:hypothetical protein
MEKARKPSATRKPPVPSDNAVFLGGAEMEPAPPLGSTGRTRYVKLRSLEEAKAPEVRRWIEQAARLPGWK